MSSHLARAADAILTLLPTRAVLACWRRGSHDWEDDLCDVPTCRDCARRQLIPREPLDIGD